MNLDLRTKPYGASAGRKAQGEKPKLPIAWLNAHMCNKCLHSAYDINLCHAAVGRRPLPNCCKAGILRECGRSTSPGRVCKTVAAQLALAAAAVRRWSCQLRRI